jgi:hypothetical protein
MGHLILIWGLIFCLIWVIFAAKDLCVRFRAHWDSDQQHKRVRHIFWLFKHEPWVHNFVNRYLYEIFFEACLCTMITVANSSFSPENHAFWVRSAYIALVGCGIFAVYIVAHYWTSLYDYFRNDTVLHFIKGVSVGIYLRHLTWVPPVAKRIGACLLRALGPCTRCCGPCCGRTSARFKERVANCTGGRFTNPCRRVRETKKGRAFLKHYDTLRLKDNKEHTEVVTTIVMTKNGVELSRTTDVYEHDDIRGGVDAIKRANSGVFDGTANDIAGNTFFQRERDQNILGLNKQRDGNSQSTAETKNKLGTKTPEAVSDTLYSLHRAYNPQSNITDSDKLKEEEAKQKIDTARTQNNGQAVEVKPATQDALLESADQWYNDQDDEKKFDIISQKPPNSNPLYDMNPQRQSVTPNSAIATPRGQISVKAKPTNRNANAQKTRGILDQDDHQMISEILSRHSEQKKEKDDLEHFEGGEDEKKSKGRAKKSKKQEDHVQDYESDSYLSEVASSYGTDDETLPSEPLCDFRGCVSNCGGWFSRCAVQCKECCRKKEKVEELEPKSPQDRPKEKRCTPKKVDCAACWTCCWSGSKQLARQVTEHPTGFLGFKKPEYGAPVKDEQAYFAKHYIAMDEELFKDVRKDVNCMEQAREKKWRRSRTFFYGLKLYHPNDVSMLHLTAYLARRIVLAFCLVFLHNYAAIGIWLLMMSAIVMIVILWRDNQWWEQSIRR